MGNQLCKTGGTGERAFADVIDILTCKNGGDSDDEPDVRMRQDRRRYRPATEAGMRAQGMPGIANPPFRPLSRSASPSKAQQAQRQALPNESHLVTYDVMADDVRLPGESCVVTSGLAPLGNSPQREYRNLADQTQADLLSPARTLSPATKLQPTRSFDIAKPYKLGDMIEIWSASQNDWRRGRVDKDTGEWLHISYQGPGGRMMSKIMPNGHEHLRFEGESWDKEKGAASPAAAADITQQPSSPQNGLPSPPPQAAAPETLFSGLSGVELSSLSLGGMMMPASASGGIYQLGDSLEIWSTSQNAWCPGKVDKADAEWVSISYSGAAGPMTKVMPNGHEHLRPQGPQGQSVFSNANREPSRDDFLPPPAPTRPYNAGDAIEIFSTSQNQWCQGSITKVDGDWVHVTYMGPGGRPMNKIMPNGHAHVRMLVGSVHGSVGQANPLYEQPQPSGYNSRPGIY